MSIRVVDQGITLRLFHTEREARKAIGAHLAISFCGGWLAKNGAGRWMDDGGFLPESWVPPHQTQASDNCQEKAVNTFRLLDVVQWVSSANASTKVKVGIVESVVRAGERPTDAQRKEADAYGAARDHDSYLVRVGKTSKSKGKLYWPRVSALQPAYQQK